MQHNPAQEHPANTIEMSLREHLLAVGASAQGPPPYPPPAVQHQGHDHPYHHEPEAASPHGPHIDPNVAGVPYSMGGDPGDDGLTPDARKGKRELSTSKRAAQNRAAQRAFRQRKEGYIKQMEEKVKDFASMETNFKNMQNENYQLREYILSLQSRLLESQSDFPPAPSHINLSSGSGAAPPSNGGADAGYGPENQLRREMEQQQQQRQPGPPPPAQVTAREDPIRHDTLAELVASGGLRPGSHASPYNIGMDYKRPSVEATPGALNHGDGKDA